MRETLRTGRDIAVESKNKYRGEEACVECGRDGCVAQEALSALPWVKPRLGDSSLNLLGVTRTSGAPGDWTGSLDCFLIRNLGTV